MLYNRTMKKEELHIYLRVSTDQQIEDGFGIDNQKELGLRVSKKLNMIPIIHNEGSKSSSKDDITERPILTELLYDVNEGKIKNIWVYNNDRLSRNENVWTHIRLTLKKNNCILYVGEGTKYELSSYLDDFIFGILSEVTKYDNSLRTERMRRGKTSKIKNGGWKGGCTPFGYDLENGQLVVNEFESKWVKFIFEEYLKGTSIYQIQKVLILNGVKSKRGKKNIISLNSIRRILDNTHYEGYWIYTDKLSEEVINVDCDRILPSTLVKKVRKKLGSKKSYSHHTKTVTLLKDFLICGHCGSKFGQNIKGKYKSHYYCRGNMEKNRKELGFQCKVKDSDVRVRSLKIDRTDKFIWDTVIDVIENSHIFKEMIKKEVMGNSKSFGQSMYEVKMKEKKIKELTKNINQIDEVIKTNEINLIWKDKGLKELKDYLKSLKETKRDFEVNIDELNSEIEFLKKEVKWVNWVDEFKDKINNLKNENLTTEEKKSFLDGLIDKIVVHTVNNQTHTLEIRFNSPMVDDKFEWKIKGNIRKGYKLIDGHKKVTLKYRQLDGNVSEKKTLEYQNSIQIH